MRQTLTLFIFLYLTTMWGQDNSQGYKISLSQYELKGKVKTLKEFKEEYWETYRKTRS
ncbi:MAG: hypothetical protein Q3983_04285 [Capnocytophaga sp.]|nr:hypothetical protein [Capnocytophaga sp.]